MRSRRLGYIIAGLAFIGLLFQLFFRYQYVHLEGATVMRIDRLSGSSCNMPCQSSHFEPASAPSTSERSFDGDDEEAIQGVKSSVTTPYENDGHDYKWRVQMRGKNDGTHHLIGNPATWEDDDPVDWPVRLICYCYNDTPGQAGPVGVYWEHHLDTRQTYSVNDNAALSAKYGMTPSK